MARKLAKSWFLESASLKLKLPDLTEESPFQKEGMDLKKLKAMASSVVIGTGGGRAFELFGEAPTSSSSPLVQNPRCLSLSLHIVSVSLEGFSLDRP